MYIPHFLEFFPWLLLISEWASMRGQFEGGNNSRASTINTATLPHSIRTALVADSARTNAESARDRYKSTVLYS